MDWCHRHECIKVNRDGIFYCGQCLLELGREHRNNRIEETMKCPNNPSHGVLINAVTDPIGLQMNGPIYVCPFCPGQEWDHYPLQRR